MSQISKIICGVFVFGYPCWNPDTDYTKEKDTIIEYGLGLYFNEKALDIGFDNTRYIHRENPENNPIFTYKEAVWKVASSSASTSYQAGQRLLVVNPNTGADVYCVAKGAGTAPVYNGLVFNDEYYSALTGAETNACSFFSAISCATWEGDLTPSIANRPSGFTVTDGTMSSAFLTESFITPPSGNIRVNNITPWNRTF